MSYYVGQAVSGLGEMKWFEFGVEEACIGSGCVVAAADANISGQGGVGLTRHAVEPCAEAGVLNGAALDVASMHVVGALFMSALRGVHGSNDGDLVHATG